MMLLFTSTSLFVHKYMIIFSKKTNLIVMITLYLFPLTLKKTVETFWDSRRLNVLKVAGNNISVIDNCALCNTSLVELDLSSNAMTDVNENMFSWVSIISEIHSSINSMFKRPYNVNYTHVLFCIWPFRIQDRWSCWACQIIGSKWITLRHCSRNCPILKLLIWLHLI